MVRLKSFAVSSALKPSEFQFHYGSIKMDLSFLPPDGLTVFQFHYGSIKIYKQK